MIRRFELPTNLTALLAVSIELKLGIGMHDGSHDIQWREAAIPRTLGRI
jgi:hypothetical protein